MLLSKHIITQDLVNMLLSWRHSGFNVFLWAKDSTRRWAGHGKPRSLYYPWLFVSRENDLYSGGIQGPLPVKGWQKGKGVRCLRVAGDYVLTRSQQGGANGALLRILQQCQAGQKGKQKPG